MINPATLALAPDPAGIRPAMSSSLARAFDVLDLFTLETPRLTSEEVSARLGYSRSMAYRYLKELCDAGLLVPQSGGPYGLGPRIIELERLVALTDPRSTWPAAPCWKGRSRGHAIYCRTNTRTRCCASTRKARTCWSTPAGNDPARARPAVSRCSGVRARWRCWPSCRITGSARPICAARRPSPRPGWARLGRLSARAGGDPQAGYAISHEQIAPGLGGVAMPFCCLTTARAGGQSGLELSGSTHGSGRRGRWARAGAGGGRDRARGMAQAGRPALRALAGRADLVQAGAQPAVRRVGVHARMPQHGYRERRQFQRQREPPHVREQRGAEISPARWRSDRCRGPAPAPRRNRRRRQRCGGSGPAPPAPRRPARVRSAAWP